MRLTDKEVMVFLGNTNLNAYKYGTLKPKIDLLMDALSKKLEEQHKRELISLKEDIIRSIKAL